MKTVADYVKWHKESYGCAPSEKLIEALKKANGIRDEVSIPNEVPTNEDPTNQMKEAMKILINVVEECRPTLDLSNYKKLIS